MYVLSSELKCVTISATSASDFTEYENALTMPKQQQKKEKVERNKKFSFMDVSLRIGRNCALNTFHFYSRCFRTETSIKCGNKCVLKMVTRE